MALWVQNISPPGLSDTDDHQYRAMINNRELVRFNHRRADGAAECFRRAADALGEAGEGLEYMQGLPRAAKNYVNKMG